MMEQLLIHDHEYLYQTMIGIMSYNEVQFAMVIPPPSPLEHIPLQLPHRH